MEKILKKESIEVKHNSKTYKLEDYSQIWAKRYNEAAKKAAEVGEKEDWSKVYFDDDKGGSNKVVFRKLIIKELLLETCNRCAFCRKYPIGKKRTRDCSLATIEHFKPKSKFIKLTYSWPNLFACCEHCNSDKADKYYENIIDISDHEYNFDDFFYIDILNGRIEVLSCEIIGKKKHEAAENFLNLYKLNNGDLPRNRTIQYLELNENRNLNLEQVNEKSYDFFTKRALFGSNVERLSSEQILKKFLT